MRQRRWFAIAAVLLAALVIGYRSRTSEPQACQAAQPPAARSAAVPDWRVEPSMLLWEHTPDDRPYPATDLSYTVYVTNLGSGTAHNLNVYLGSELFGWQEMRFDYGKAPAHLTCPELAPGQRNAWAWSHTWRTKAGPSWRKSMEETAELRFVWQGADGWHELRGKLPSQYAPYTFHARDLK